MGLEERRHFLGFILALYDQPGQDLKDPFALIFFSIC